MTAWVQITPRRGKRPEPKVGVTIALRRKAGSPHSLAITFRAGLVATLGWLAKEHVTVSRNQDGTKLLFARAPQSDDTFAIHGSRGSTCLYVNFGILPAEAEARAAEDTTHEVTREGVVVAVPAWATVAMGLPAPVAAVPARPAPVTFPPVVKQPVKRGQPEFPGVEQADIEEARRMMRGGKIGAAALVEYFGCTEETAVKIAAAIRDDLAAEGRRKVA